MSCLVTVTIDTQVRTAVTFRDTDDALADPPSVLCYVKAPDGTETIYTYLIDVDLVRDSVGRYHLNFLADQVGDWKVRWQAPNYVTADAFFAAIDGTY